MSPSSEGTQSKHSERTVLTHRSANALAFGARIGVVMTRTPFRSEHLVERPGEPGVPFADQEPDIREPAVHGKVAGLLGHPGRVWVGSRPGDVHPSRAKLDEEQDVEGLQPDRLHGEESPAMMPAAY